MTVFQLFMLAASAFFAFKIYEHIQTLKDPKESDNETQASDVVRGANTFSTFSAQALDEKADVAFYEKDFQKALALLQEADAKETGNADRIFKIGYILQEVGDSEEALKYYYRALELDKSNEYIHNSMASIFRNKQEYASARLHLNSSLEINNENPITYFNYGNLLVDMTHLDEAKEMYENALKLNPDFIEAKEELAKLKVQQ